MARKDKTPLIERIPWWAWFWLVVVPPVGLVIIVLYVIEYVDER